MRASRGLGPCAVVLALCAQAVTAHAVCLDPRTGQSGYRTPLGVEVAAAEAIVIGRVQSEEGLSDDPEDPDGISAFRITIDVLENLKGKAPAQLVVMNDNTSSRYAMAKGEEHLLFLSQDGNRYWVNACGNSATRHEAEGLLKELRQLLRTKN